MKYKIYQKGKSVPADQGIALLQEEAVGIFESMRAYDGRILHEEEHIARLLESAKTVGHEPVPVAAKLKIELSLAMNACGEKNTSVRLTLFNGKIFVIIGSRECSPEFYKTGVVLKTASFPRGSGKAFPYQAKAAAYQQAVLASTEPNPGKAFDWLFLDQSNYLTETRVGNFFIVRHPASGKGFKGVVILTPPEHLILNGVTRRFVIKCALALGFLVREVPLTRHEFFNADEAFLSNTSWEVLPVRELDGRMIGEGKPGPVTLKLHDFFKRRVQHDVASHHSPSTH